MPKSERPTALPVVADSIPDTLKEHDRWVCWRYVRDKGEHTWKKRPLSARTGAYVNVKDPATHATFAEAWAYYREHRVDGIGFVFVADDPFSGIDLDDCRDPKAGTLEPREGDLVRELGTYAEVSPSGTGVKLFVFGKLPPGSRTRTGNVEVYSRDRFFAVTGAHLDGTPTTVEDRQEALEGLHARLFAAPAGQSEVTGPSPLTDEQILHRARTAKNGAKFIRLYDQGDTTGYESPSEADLALASLLAYWVGDAPERVESLMSRSALGQRGKWQDREDYRERVIDQAMQGLRQYGPAEGGMLHRLVRTTQLD
jgi:putative DNA primase/helicase